MPKENVPKGYSSRWWEVEQAREPSGNRPLQTWSGPRLPWGSFLKVDISCACLKTKLKKIDPAILSQAG